jgi:hypothetical protein
LLPLLPLFKALLLLLVFVVSALCLLAVDAGKVESFSGEFATLVDDDDDDDDESE